MDKSILQEAHDLVYGDRREAYGHPSVNMAHTAEIATPLLSDVLRPGARLIGRHIAMIMIAVKLSRECHRPGKDNRRDGAGYWGVLDVVETDQDHRDSETGWIALADKLDEHWKEVERIVAGV